MVGDALQEEGVVWVSLQVQGWVRGCETARGEDSVLVGAVDAVEFWRAGGCG